MLSWFKQLSKPLRMTRSARRHELQVETFEPLVLMSGSLIEIHAAGDEGFETLELRIDDVTVETFENISTDGEVLLFMAEGPVDASQIQIAFVNDVYDPENEIDANLTIDRIVVDGETFETETSTTFGVGVWTGTGFEPDFHESETLHGNGFFQFVAEPDDPTETDETNQPPPPTGPSTTIQVAARGDVGTESFRVLSNGRVLGEFDVTTEFDTYSFVTNNYTPGADIQVEFFNDIYDPENGIDANLFVESVSLNGDLNVRSEAFFANGIATYAFGMAIDPQSTDPQPAEPPLIDPVEVDRNVIVGTEQGEFISGTDADDFIIAGGGDDAIHAPVGNNLIAGGDGTDTLVIYDGPQDQFTATILVNGDLQLIGPGLNDPQITYQLRNVERVEFTNGIIDVANLNPQPTDPQPTDPQPTDPQPTDPSDLDPTISTGIGIEAFHRSGQTFLTWDELTTVNGAEYHIYRHTEEITAANLSEAVRLTEKWGPLDDDTSVHQLAGNGAPTNFVITDLGEALDDDTGLFVYTTQDGENGDAWYAVTVVIDGVEQPLTADGRLLDAPVEETTATAAPILVNSVNDGRGLVFTQFMDYSQWNPTFQGYAYNYAVALPEDYSPNVDYSLKVELHAYGERHRFLPQTEFDWNTIQLFVDDPGSDRGTTHTWWFGFAGDHNYQTDGDTPTSGTVENFTQQRILKAIDEVSERFSVDENRIHAQGNSMGASGALSLGIHYGEVFSGIFANQPITNYETNPLFQDSFARVWGTAADNLNVSIGGPHSENIVQYSDGQPNETGIYDWLDHGEQLLRRRGETISFLAFNHGKLDNIIDWETQGRPFVEAVDAANVGYTALHAGNSGHSWLGFAGIQHSLFSNGFADLGDWSFENNVSFPAISNASTSVFPSPDFGDNSYNLSFDWATPWNPFDEPIIDTEDAYAVTIRSTDGPAFADITPRNLQNFSVEPGELVDWQNVDQNTGEVLDSGTAVADEAGLITLQDIAISNGAGSRLIIETRNN